MNINHLTSKRLKASDVKKPLLLTIATVTEEIIGNDECIVVSFEEIEETVNASKTALLQLKQIAQSAETDDWIGEMVVLYNDPNVTFNNKKVGGLRFRAPKGKAAADAQKRRDERAKQQGPAAGDDGVDF